MKNEEMLWFLASLDPTRAEDLCFEFEFTRFSNDDPIYSIRGLLAWIMRQGQKTHFRFRVQEMYRQGGFKEQPSRHDR